MTFCDVNVDFSDGFMGGIVGIFWGGEGKGVFYFFVLVIDNELDFTFDLAGDLLVVLGVVHTLFFSLFSTLYQMIFVRFSDFTYCTMSLVGDESLY